MNSRACSHQQSVIYKIVPWGLRQHAVVVIFCIFDLHVACSDILNNQKLRDWDTFADASDVVVDEVTHDKQLNKLHCHYPIAYKRFDVVIWIGKLVIRGEPEDKRDQLRRGLCKEEMRSERLSLALLLEHEKLREHGNRL